MRDGSPPYGEECRAAGGSGPPPGAWAESPVRIPGSRTPARMAVCIQNRNLLPRQNHAQRARRVQAVQRDRGRWPTNAAGAGLQGSCLHGFRGHPADTAPARAHRAGWNGRADGPGRRRPSPGARAVLSAPRASGGRVRRARPWSTVPRGCSDRAVSARGTPPRGSRSCGEDDGHRHPVRTPPPHARRRPARHGPSPPAGRPRAP